MRVDMAASNVHKDVKNTIFIGNLPFHATEEQVQIFFAECGDIDYVRIVRDSQTFIGKVELYIYLYRELPMLNLCPKKDLN